MNAPRLKWKAADGRSQEYLVAAPEIVIGRGGGADLLLPSLHVSRRHAKLVCEAGTYAIQDLESSYGTFVNGERIARSVLRHGDRIIFGKGDEFHFYIDSAEQRQDLDTTKIVQRSLVDLGKVLPSEASDLEKMLCVLNLQNEWNQVFTPENALNQILENALRISGAERAFIMTKDVEGFGYAAGMDGRNRKLSESQFRTSQSIVRNVVAKRHAVFMVEGIGGIRRSGEHCRHEFARRGVPPAARYSNRGRLLGYSWHSVSRQHQGNAFLVWSGREDP